MNYQETIDLLYSKLPSFQNLGKKAIKPKLTNIIALCEHLGNPQNNFKSIHIAGTNGKGSTSHLISSILQESGLKVGLYTSPHLKDFSERFRINGQKADKDFIINFVKDNLEIFEKIKPSFFEVSVALAFKYFSDQKVDIAVVEVGLGGRFDSTNIIKPILSIITNIGYDHQDVLGDTLDKIAFEKAGIIKNKIPVVISEYHSETHEVFKNEANVKESEIYFSEDFYRISVKSETLTNLSLKVKDLKVNVEYELSSQLVGNYQIKNIQGVLTSINILKTLDFNISQNNIVDGIQKVIVNTELKGRWQILNTDPISICDTGHNENAFTEIIKKLQQVNAEDIVFLLGFVKDKDVNKIVNLLPKNSIYYFSTFNSNRSLSLENLQNIGTNFKNFKGVFSDVNHAIESISKEIKKENILYIGGSTYLIAEINNL